MSSGDLNLKHIKGKDVKELDFNIEADILSPRSKLKGSLLP